MAFVRRVLGSASDRWFSFRVWVRYDMFWTRSGRSVFALSLLVPLLATGLLLRPGAPVSGGGTNAPVALPLTTLPPSRVSEASLPGGVLVVGDSLVAGEEDVYASAFAAVGVDAVFDAAVSRGLRRGWLCPAGSSRFGSVVGSTEEPDDGLGGLPGDDTGEDGTSEDDDPGTGSTGEADPDDINSDDPDAPGSDDSDRSGTEPLEDPVPGDELSPVGDGRAPSEDDGCRRQGLEALAWYATSGELPPAVVVALGTNDASRPATRVRADLDELRRLLGGRRLFIVATATSPMTELHTGWNATARSWCATDGLCEFVEWAPEDPAALFAPDGVHLNALGAQERARAIALAVVSPR